MKNNKGFIGMGLILAIIAVLIIGGGAYYVGKNSNSYKDVAVVTNKTQQSISSNKLFDFFDTLITEDKDVGTERIEFVYPGEKLILLSYATSSETRSYAVYDYKNNILYKDIGNEGIGGGSYPVAFIGTDKLLVYSDAEDQKHTLTVQDFNNKVIKTIMSDTPLYEVYPNYGKVINIDINTKESGRFKLDSETLELTPWTR